MTAPPLDPSIDKAAPTTPDLTPYDHQHLITYLRLLDAQADQADWREVAQLVLHLDPVRDPIGARATYDSHLERARWMTAHGYRELLTGDPTG